MPKTQIDRDKLRAAIRGMGDEYIYFMLDDAIELLPQTKLLKLVKEHFPAAQISQLCPDSDAQGDLLPTVKRFEEASLAGEYYESVDVNSHHFMELPQGTRAWVADFRRLLLSRVDEARHRGQAGGPLHPVGPGRPCGRGA